MILDTLKLDGLLKSKPVARCQRDERDFSFRRSDSSIGLTCRWRGIRMNEIIFIDFPLFFSLAEIINDRDR